jgi:ferritin-like metal-binding protein YciE
MQHDRLIEWLNNAYVLEQGMIPVLETHARGAMDFPEIRERLDEHYADTVSHREQLARCLRLLGIEPPRARAVAASATGLLRGAASLLPRDAVLADLIDDYAAESREIATYTALIAAARALQETEIASVCSRILDDEVEMAVWIEAHIPEMSVRALQAAAV